MINKKRQRVLRACGRKRHYFRMPAKFLVDHRPHRGGGKKEKRCIALSKKEKGKGERTAQTPPAPKGPWQRKNSCSKREKKKHFLRTERCKKTTARGGKRESKSRENRRPPLRQNAATMDLGKKKKGRKRISWKELVVGAP